MTPIQKAKEIAVKYNNWVEETYLKGEETGLWFTYRHYANEENGKTDDEIYDLWLATPQAAALLSGEDWKEDKDSFAIAFAAWCIGPEGEMYRASGVSASKLLQLYKDRPYINTDHKIN